MNRKKYLDIFAREAEEHLGMLRQGFLGLEQEGWSAARAQELLRSAHTLKGSARLLNLETLGLVTHELETLLKALETGARALSPTLIDLLLTAADAIEALVAQAHSEGEITVNVDAVLEGLRTGTMPVQPAVAVPAAEKMAKDTIRASVVRLDQMVNLLGELLVLRDLFEGHGSQLKRLLDRVDQFLGRLRKAENYRLLKELHDDFSTFSFDLERDTINLQLLAGDLHHRAMELRMLPLSTITEELVRMTRGLARDQEKDVQLVVSGEEVELDRLMLEAAKPMLLHMLRNAVDHGIEPPEQRARTGKPATARIELSARYEGGFVRLGLRDDGRGIDVARVREVAVQRGLITAEEAQRLPDDEVVYLILRPGFSTADRITEVSGRGVGMDVVKANIDRVKGNLVIHSRPGQGTEFTLHLPLTLALITGLIILCEGETYAVPLHYVSEILRLGERDILTEGGREVIRVRDRTLPLVQLRDLLGLPPQQALLPASRITALILKFREQHLACLVTRSLEVQELVVKNMGQQLKSLDFFSGATILRDGTPALILSVPDVFSASFETPATHLRREYEAAREHALKGRVLVVDDSITTRTMEKNILETHGYQVTVAVSGPDALGKLATDAFDLVVSDVEMPGMDGFELTRQLRQMERTKDLPVIIVTSLASDSDRRKGIEVGAQAYIVKGNFDQGTLLETVETLIG